MMSMIVTASMRHCRRAEGKIRVGEATPARASAPPLCTYSFLQVSIIFPQGFCQRNESKISFEPTQEYEAASLSTYPDFRAGRKTLILISGQ